MTGADRKFLWVICGWVKLSLSMTGCFCGRLKPPCALGLVVAGWATCYTTAPAALNGIDFGDFGTRGAAGDLAVWQFREPVGGLPRAFDLCERISYACTTLMDG